jgi:aspartate/methionine/tyrosine aminotransferase/drug/metabolite transporter (DMT)-like permease
VRDQAAPGRGSAGLAALLVLSMAIWGGTWPSGKIVAPLAAFEATVFLRFLVTSLALLVVCLWRRENLALHRSAVAWALLGAALMSAYNYFFLGGLSWGLAAKGGVIVTCLNPVLTFAISAVAFRRKVGRLEAVGLALGLGAGALLLGVWKLDAAELFRSGNLFFLCAALAWSSLTVVSQAGQRRAGALAFSLWVYGLSTVLNAAVVALRGFRFAVSSPPLYWVNLLYLGVLGTAFATTVYFLASRRLGAHRASSFIFLVPGFALLLGWLLLGEVPEWTTLAGLAVAIGAVSIVNRAGAGAGAGAGATAPALAAAPGAPDQRAMDLNAVLDRGPAGALLSELGRRLSLPRGIVVQAGEAKRLAVRFDGSAGVALERRTPLHLSAVQSRFSGLEPADLYSYSPTQGNPALRKLWGELLLEKNPSLAGACLSLPTVVPGLTFGVSAAADLFLDPGDTVFVPEPCWDNYDLVFRVRRGARIAGWPLFDAGDRFSVSGLRAVLADARRSGMRRAVALFNFPHNPSGYTPTREEAGAIAGALEEAARSGLRIVALLDDAYFGLTYEQEAERESLFARLVRSHEGILAVKVDGTTKEDLAWGFRIAFVTFGGAAVDRAACDALEEKLAGELRSVVSSASTPAQTLLLGALRSGGYRDDKDAAFRLLEGRYRVVRRVLDRLAREHPELARPLPFNSGYFVCLRLPGGGADAVRRRLLESEGIGTVALGEELLRIAYSAVDADGLEPMLEAVYRVIGDSRGGNA